MTRQFFFLIVLFLLSSRTSSQEVQLQIEATNSSNQGKGIQVVGQGVGVQVDNIQLVSFISQESGTDGFFSNVSGRHGFIAAGSEENDFYSLSPLGDGFRSSGAGAFGFSALNSGNVGFYSQGSASHGFQSLNSGSVGFYTRNATSFGFRSDDSSQDSYYSNSPAGNGYVSNNAGSNGFNSSGSVAASFYSINPGTHGLQTQNAAGNGVLVQNPQNDGIAVTGAGGRAGFFRSAESSATPAVFIQHDDNTKTDIQIGGTGRISAQKSVVITIDDNNDESSRFIIRNGNGVDVAVIEENGDASFAGAISKGSGTFKIDHPLYPTEKYLYHSFVESPDMMNIYNGNVTTDQKGIAVVELPEYFQALNRQYRYQLTSIGSFGQAIIKEEIENGKFVIQTEKPNTKVSWQVTGVRKDRFAKKNRVQVEVDKEPEAQGTYLHPEVWINNKLEK